MSTLARMAKKQKLLTPAELVVARFNIGIRPLAKLLEQDPSSICKWIARGGHIPNSQRNGDTHKRLLSIAKERGAKLTAEELIHGGYL